MNIRIRCFPYALKNSRRCRGVLKFKYTDSSIVAKTDYGNFQFTLNQDRRAQLVFMQLPKKMSIDVMCIVIITGGMKRSCIKYATTPAYTGLICKR